MYQLGDVERADVCGPQVQMHPGTDAFHLLLQRAVSVALS